MFLERKFRCDAEAQTFADPSVTGNRKVSDLSFINRVIEI